MKNTTAWDVKNVKPQAEVVQDARQKQVPVHFASIKGAVSFEARRPRAPPESVKDEQYCEETQLQTSMVFRASLLSRALQFPKRLQESSRIRCADHFEWRERPTTQFQTYTDAPRLPKLPETECPQLRSRPRNGRPADWDNMDPMVLSECKMHDHPLARVLKERKLEEILVRNDLGKVKLWECLDFQPPRAAVLVCVRGRLPHDLPQSKGGSEVVRAAKSPIWKILFHSCERTVEAHDYFPCG